jgi:hypothetical protein
MENNFYTQNVLEKKPKTPKLLLATFGLVLPFTISSCSNESISKKPDRKVDPVQIEKLNPIQKVISDLRKYAPISNDIPEGVVKFQYGDIYRTDLSDPITKQMMEDNEEIAKKLKEKDGKIDAFSPGIGGHGYIVKDRDSGCNIMVTANHVSSQQYNREDTKNKYNFTQIEDYTNVKTITTINNVKNNGGEFVNIIGNEKSDFSLSVSPDSKINQCINIFYNKYLGQLPKAGDVVTEFTTFNPIIISMDKKIKKPYFDLSANISTENPMGNIVRKIPLTILSSKIGNIKSVMGFENENDKQIPDSVILALTQNLNLGGKLMKNAGVGISGSVFFDEKGKIVGSHHGTIKPGNLSDTISTELKNPELLKLQQNCKITKPALEPKACEAIKNVDPKKVQLIMIANPYIDSPFVKE